MSLYQLASRAIQIIGWWIAFFPLIAHKNIWSSARTLLHCSTVLKSHIISKYQLNDPYSKFWYDHEGRGFVFDPTGDWSDPYSWAIKCILALTQFEKIAKPTVAKLHYACLPQFQILSFKSNFSIQNFLLRADNNIYCIEHHV